MWRKTGHGTDQRTTRETNALSMKRVAVLGSTGSIGTNTLEVIANHPDRLALAGVAARSRIDVLESQMARYAPPLVAVFDEAKAAALKTRGHGSVEILSGLDGLTQLATHPSVDIVVVGTAGPEALIPLLRAIEAGKRIALASKELLVMAGELIMQAVRTHQTCFIPVDSEHAALFQTLQGIPRQQVVGLTLTGSGGPLWSLSPSQMAQVTRAQVLTHPKWQMGQKITVDSATLMNKGLEVIEAQWLFEMPLERLHVVIHPQALIHAFVELTDGTRLAQLSRCDMRLPIQYALSFPERWEVPWPGVQMRDLARLEFFEPPTDRFPCFHLALEVARRGGSSPAVLSAANDQAVHAYLAGQVAFADIPIIIQQTLARHEPVPHPTLDEILQVDRWARQTAGELIQHPTPTRSAAPVDAEAVPPPVLGPPVGRPITSWAKMQIPPYGGAGQVVE